jgi:predicted DNA-binding transcriptional regulator AlpA
LTRLGEDTVPALKLSVAEAALKLGVSRQTLYRIVKCQAPPNLRKSK